MEAVPVANQAPKAPTAAPRISVLVPLGARYEDLGRICQALRRVLAAEAGGHEVIFIDDASGAQTRVRTRAVSEAFPEVRVIRLQRSMGESTAIALGAQHARGEWLVTLDPYLHVAIEELPKVLAPLRDGADLVCVWRTQRREGGISQAASSLFNAAAAALTGVKVHDLNCRTRAMRREVMHGMPLYGDLHRFLPIFAVRRGAKLCEVRLPQQPGKREVGGRKWRSYVKGVFDLLTLLFLTRFAKRPLHFFGLIGAASLLAGAVMCAHLAYIKLAFGTGIGHRPLLLLGVLLCVVGIQVASIGLLGELIIFTHARDLEDYVVSDEAGG